MKMTCFCGEKSVYVYRATWDEFQIQPCQKCIDKAIEEMKNEAFEIIGENKNE